MNKVLGFLLAAVAVVGLSTTQVLARGGGHGGGHHGGGHHGGGHHGGQHSHHGNHSHHHTSHHSHTHSHHGDHHHYHHSNWAHHNRPFSHGWYGRHGGAWGYGWGGWGWGNPWAVATFGATAAWLGLDAVEPYYGNYGTVDNYLTSDETTEPEGDDTSGDDAHSDTQSNEQSASSEHESAPSPITPEQIAAAKQLIAEGKNDPPKDTSFLPLGVFSIAPEGQHEASAMVQLAVSKSGQMRGTYYDLLTDHDQPIRGAVNKKTQQVAFTFGDKGKVTFETSLANLTQDTGAIAAHFENGKTSTWTLARYAKEPSENEAGEATPPAQPQSETAVQ